MSEALDQTRQWVPVTLLLNSLNRSLGQNDAYPFALSAGALHKLRYVHDVIHAAGAIVPDQTPRPPLADAPRIWQPSSAENPRQAI